MIVWEQEGKGGGRELREGWILGVPSTRHFQPSFDAKENYMEEARELHRWKYMLSNQRPTRKRGIRQWGREDKRNTHEAGRISRRVVLRGRSLPPVLRYQQDRKSPYFQGGIHSQEIGQIIR